MGLQWVGGWVLEVAERVAGGREGACRQARAVWCFLRRILQALSEPPGNG